MIKWIYGNTLPLAVTLHEVIYTQGGKTEQDYIPPVGSVIEVWAIGEYAKKQFDFTIDGNVVTFKDDGTLGIGTYGIKITVVEPESRRLRSFKCAEVTIINCTEDLELGEFVIPDEAITLDAATFYWAKGDKGDKGDTGVGIANITQNADYTFTITLDDGTSYTTGVLRGAKGEQGEQGVKGDTGNGIASAVLNADYTLTLTFTDGTSYTTPNIRGEKGEKGDKGDKGDDGNYTKPASGIPSSDMTQEVQDSLAAADTSLQEITTEEFNEIFN